MAIEVDGWLADVVVAGEPRDDIGRWKGTDGYHGFACPVPAPAAEETRLNVFNADTGRPLRIERGQATADRTDEA